MLLLRASRVNESARELSKWNLHSLQPCVSPACKPCWFLKPDVLVAPLSGLDPRSWVPDVGQLWGLRPTVHCRWRRWGFWRCCLGLSYPSRCGLCVLPCGGLFQLVFRLFSKRFVACNCRFAVSEGGVWDSLKLFYILVELPQIFIN